MQPRRTRCSYESDSTCGLPLRRGSTVKGNGAFATIRSSLLRGVAPRVVERATGYEGTPRPDERGQVREDDRQQPHRPWLGAHVVLLVS